jgi:hypothetical protein
MTGQFVLRTIESKLDNLLGGEFKTSGEKYLTYIDTDSCRGDSLVYANGAQIPIEQLFNDGGIFIKRDEQNRDYVRTSTNILTKSFNTRTQQVEEKPIKYIMKHRVKKEMFKITCGNKEVIVTCDHSVIIKRGNEFLDVKPSDILPTDQVIKLKNY